MLPHRTWSGGRRNGLGARGLSPRTAKITTHNASSPHPILQLNRLILLIGVTTLGFCTSWVHPSKTGDAGTDLFVDAAQAAGIDFRHFNGMSGEYYFCEMMGPGGALLDYDNDGDLDVYLVQGQMLGPDKTLDDALFPPPEKPPLRDRLFRNDLKLNADGTPNLRFTDVTVQSGIVSPGYGMGAAAGDIDNDGWIDLYVTNFGKNRMYRNNGNGTFTQTPVGDDADNEWSVSASFLDYDRDGWLDLFVGNYVDYDLSNPKKCYSSTGAIDYCGPRSYPAQSNRFYRNRGDGSFRDVSSQSGIATRHGGALGVVSADFNGDGWIDFYVANDQRPNHLWINQRNGSYREEALVAGCALNRDGKTEASMGVDAGDLDNDGDEDLFMTHLIRETNTLYLNNGQGWFEDQTFETELGVASMPYTGFGTAFLDYDNDGWLDILALHGEVATIEALEKLGDPYPLHQPNQLFHNLGNGRFEEVTVRGGAAFKLSEVSRGGAFGDVDNDGDVDVLIVNNNGPARLLINNVGQRRHWLGLRLLGRDIPRDMLGARVEVVFPDGLTLLRRVRTDGSYGSANDPRVLVGLGNGNRVAAVRVSWPGGGVEEWIDLPVNRYTTLRAGSGRMVSGNE